jgi:hypothetical protein
MKIKRHFLYSKIKSSVSRMYGGEDYTLALYENQGRGKIVRLGEVSACSRAHKGEEHEAWSAIFAKLPKRAQSAMMKHPAVVETNGRTNGGHFPQYCGWSLREALGIKLDSI